MYPVYVLISMINPNKTYVGITNNIFRRWCEHNKGRSKYTSLTRPFRLVYQEEYEVRSEAMKREKALKGGQGRQWLKSAILNTR